MIDIILVDHSFSQLITSASISKCITELPKDTLGISKDVRDVCIDVYFLS